jgi:hypothetical protein
MTRERLTGRLEKLKSELESGQKMLVDLEAKHVNLQQTLLRISGAIQVLEELVAEECQPGDKDGQSTAALAKT